MERVLGGYRAPLIPGGCTANKGARPPFATIHALPSLSPSPATAGEGQAQAVGPQPEWGPHPVVDANTCDGHV